MGSAWRVGLVTDSVALIFGNQLWDAGKVTVDGIASRAVHPATASG